MKRFGIWFAGAVAVAFMACAGSTRSGKVASSRAPGASAAAAESTTEGGAASSATGSMPSGPTASPAGGASELQGRVERIDRASNLTLAGTESVGHAFEQLKIDSSTEITVHGEKGTLSEINEGDEVRAAFSGSGDDLHVDRLEILSPAD
jgi:hypothetical protein